MLKSEPLFSANEVLLDGVIQDLNTHYKPALIKELTGKSATAEQKKLWKEIHPIVERLFAEYQNLDAIRRRIEEESSGKV